MARTSLIEASALRDSDYLVLDARREDAYENGHRPAAVHVPVAAWEVAAKQAETGLDNDAHWKALIGSLGIAGGRPVAVYDDGRMTEAARVWYILQHFGVDAAVIDGGWLLLLDQPDHHVETVPNIPLATTFRGVRAVGSVGLLSRDEVKDALGQDTSILDARTAAEFQGDDLRNNHRGGHLPNARRIGHGDLLASDGRLKPAEEIRTIFADAGFKPGDRIVTHCDGGGRAALAALAAVEAGFTDVNTYYLSFSDWAKDESCPIIQK